MNQYCYNVEGDSIDADVLKAHINKIYRKKKFGDLAFATDEPLPFIVIYSQTDKQVCIKMTSRAKKNVERIEEIHSKLKAVDLKIGDIVLSEPSLVTLEQCAWWDTDCKIAKGQKWATLSHNGPYFVHLMEPYEPHDAPLIYDGEEYELSPEEERVASFYARRIISEESGNVTQLWTKDKVFNKNFWTDFKKYLSPAHKKIFTDFSKMDFSLIVKRLEALKDSNKQITAAQKTTKKVIAAEKKQNYGYAYINGIKEPLGNFTIEPAAIFYGRGENPNRGKIKRDIEPEEVTINIGEQDPIPAPPDGHEWKAVVHDHDSSWVASWKDPISGENKYVYFAAEGQLKGKSDLFKYEKARKLSRYIDTVRKQYTADITGKLKRNRQLGTVLYLIDNYGIRVGNEKDESETDTVGASTLRVEHVKLKEPNTVVFDFLGKDSIRFYKEIPVDDEVYANFKAFIAGKKPSDQLFDLISAADINAYLKTFDKDFSAKVFRTRLASTVMADALKKSKVKKGASQDDIKKIFTQANIEVAKLLNHQRSVSAKSEETIKKYQAELKELNKEKKSIAAAGKSTNAIETKIKKKKDQIANKKDTLNIAINTSLMNYIDPRIVVGWSKAHELSIPKVYTATLQKKFKWAIDMTDDDWDYSDTDLLPEMAKLEPQVDAKPPAGPKKVASKPVAKKLFKPIAPVPVVKPIVKLTSKDLAKPFAKPPAAKPPLTSKDLAKPFSKPPVAKPAPTSKDLAKPGAKPIAKAPVAPAKTSVGPQPTLHTYANVSIVQYSPKAVAVIGNTKEIKDALKDLGGKFNPYLTVNGDKVPGWIFSAKHLASIEELMAQVFQDVAKPVSKTAAKPVSKSVAKPVSKSAAKPDGPKQTLHTKVNISIIQYSPKSIAVIGNTTEIKDALKDLGGKYNKYLNVNGDKVPGWIFSAKRLASIVEWLDANIPETPTEPAAVSGDSILDSLNMSSLTRRERNIIKCFGRDPNVVRYLKEDMIHTNDKIYNIEFLAKFLSCLDGYDKSTSEKDKLLKKYLNRTLAELSKDLSKRLLPSSIPTFMFLIYILHQTSSRMKEVYLSQLMNHMYDTTDIQQCLCDNSQDDTLVSMEPIKDIPIKDLYLLPSGRCVHMDDLISHLKLSDNKIVDPTYVKSKHGPVQDLTWTNGWELNALLSRIVDYNYEEGFKIRDDFKKVLKTVTSRIPEHTRLLISEVAPLFYFPIADSDQQLINLLVKYGYPTGEGAGNLSAAKEIVEAGGGPELDDFRTRLGYEVGMHIMDELSPDQREAVLFSGEFVGLGREAWGKLSMGQFCTKTFGSLLERLSMLFIGKYNLSSDMY